MKYSSFIVLSLLTFQHTHGSVNFTLSEKSLAKLIKGNPPNIKLIEAAFLGTVHAQKNVQEKLSWNLKAQTSHFDTSEKPYSTSDQIQGPKQYHSLGVERSFKYGLNLGVSAYSRQATTAVTSQGLTSKFKNATTSGLSINFGIDLYKDLFGKKTRADLDILRFGKEKAAIEKDIQSKAFHHQVRKIYWSLVANNEKLKISSELLLNSEKQAKNANKRYSSSVADSGEVAKFESQVAFRKANIIYLDYQKEMLLLSLKEIIPELAEKNVILSEYNLDNVVSEVISCTTRISLLPEVPLNFTRYDELVEALNNQYASQKKSTRTHSDIDLKLTSNLKTLGKAQGYSESFDAHNNNSGTSYEVGLMLTIPLGKKKSSTEEVKKLLEEKKYLATQKSSLGKIKTFHYQITKEIDLLKQVCKMQKINSEKLAHSLKITRKKYHQARTSVYNLINDQDGHLQSKLSEIDTKLVIVTTLLDYFAVFTEIPCDFNITEIP